MELTADCWRVVLKDMPPLYLPSNIISILDKICSNIKPFDNKRIYILYLFFFYPPLELLFVDLQFNYASEL